MSWCRGPGMDSMPYLLNLIYVIVLLLLLPWLLFRALTTNRYRRGLRQKLFGSVPVLGADKPVVWFHGVSVGEINLLVTVVKAFCRRHPDWHCVISTTTETGMAEAKKHFADLCVIFYPFDFSWAVKRALNALRPRLIVLAESELWPNFLRIAAGRAIPVVVINGRMSPRSSRRFRKIALLARRLLFKHVARFAMQAESYAQALLNLGVPSEKITVTGSVKYDGVLGDRNNPQTKRLGEQLGIAADDLIWVAGSTHAPEEEIVLAAFAKMRELHPSLRLILVPRSADRFDEVADLIECTRIPFIRKSKLKEPAAQSRDGAQTLACAAGSQPCIMLIDTIGDLNAAWGLADVGFTGGSFDGRRGGQSMIEPAGLGVPVVFGPHVWNFRDAVARLLEVGGAIQIASAGELDRELMRILGDSRLRIKMGEAARALVIAQQGATERTLDLLDQVMAAPTVKQRAA
jgi:3-deoxy-D-manno-octulosonic-acid transferase